MRLNIQPTLEDNLVRLRPLAENDFDALFAVACDPLIWEQHPNSDRYQQPVFERFFNDAMNSGGALLILDINTQEVIGSSRYQVLEGIHDGIEIGWSFLARNYWGGKYNRAVKELMVRHALKVLDAVVFYVDGNNLRSQRALEKIGAQLLTDTTYQHMLNPNPGKLTFILTK